MLISLISGRLADKVGRIKVLLIGLTVTIITPLLYGFAGNFLFIALFHGLNGVGFWTIQTIGFTFAGDITPENKRGKFFSRYNTVNALNWGAAGFLVGGPLADVQIKTLGLTTYSSYLNVFYLSSLIVFVGTILFWLKIIKKSSVKKDLNY